MNIPRLSITTTKGKIGMESTLAKVEIQQPTAPTLDLQTEQVKVEIRSTAPKVLIDQTQPFAESGLMKPIALSEDNAAYSRSKMMESVGKIAEQGNELMKIENGGNPIADQALYNAYDQFIREWNIVTMPKSRPKIDVIEGTVDIQVRGGKVHNNTRYQGPVYKYSPPNLKIYMRQQPSINISVQV